MQIITGDCMNELQSLEAESVHCCMTSPPYWNLRDYDHDDQLGLERDSEGYVQNIADVMDEVKRVLREDGSLWLNLGDTYDDKDLQQIPARVALELQQRGWMLRNRVTWAKPNPMPQSVKDRLNDTTEAVFHFVKNKDYWYDLDAIRTGYSEVTKRKSGNGYQNGKSKRSESDDITDHKGGGGLHDPEREWDSWVNPAGKNPGDVFEVTTKPFPEAHFAVYPPELCEKPIKATVPPKVCPECGSPYERQTRNESGFTDGVCNACGESKSKHKQGSKNKRTTGGAWNEHRACSNRVMEKWKQTCNCDTDDTEPGTILDPFAGAGTTLLKAKELGRDAIGIELNPEYADMARARIGLEPNDPANVREDKEQNGLEQY